MHMRVVRDCNSGAHDQHDSERLNVVDFPRLGGSRTVDVPTLGTPGGAVDSECPHVTGYHGDTLAHSAQSVLTAIERPGHES